MNLPWTALRPVEEKPIMTRARSRATNSVSLFPFLAVLICAMGALIFLLLVTTRRIRQQALLQAQAAVTESKPEPLLIRIEDTNPDEITRTKTFEFAAVEAPVPDLPAVIVADEYPEPEPADPNDELRALIAKLSRQRDDQRRQWNGRRNIIQTTQSRLAHSQSKLSQLQEQSLETREQRAGYELTEKIVATQRSEFSDQLAEAERRLERLRQQNVQQSSQYAIVPFDGQSGTTRRPILIECTDKGLRFMQEDIVLTAADVDGFTIPYNPLLAGTRALIRHWTARDLREGNGGADPAPYILLIVRPSGSVAYYAARKMLRQLNQQTGYELLDENFELAVSEPDPQATAACRRAIDELIAERQRIVEALSSGSRGRGQRLRFRGGPDGFEVVRPDRSRFGRTGQAIFGQPNGNRFGRRRRPVDNSVNSSANAGRSQSGLARRPGRDIDDRFGNVGGGRGETGRGTVSPRGTSNSNSQRNRGGVGLTPGGASETETASSVRKAGQGTQSAGGKANAANRRGERGAEGFGGTRRRGDGSVSSDGASTNPFPELGRPPSGGAGGSGERRRAWGLSNRRAGIGFERETAIQISTDRIRVGNQSEISVGIGETPEQLVQKVFAALDSHARTWGRPPQNFYWVPSVRFVIAPGGNQYYERLHGPLRKWGIASKAEYRLDYQQTPNRPE